MAKQPVERKRAYAKPTDGIGRGNSTEPKAVSTASRIKEAAAEVSWPSLGEAVEKVQPTLCHGRGGLNQDASLRPVEKEHKVSDQHQESVGSTPSGMMVSVDSTLVVSSTGNAGIGVVSDRHSLKEALQVLGLSQGEFSVLANTPLDTVKGWSSGKTKTPGIAMALVRLLAQMR